MVRGVFLFLALALVDAGAWAQSRCDVLLIEAEDARTDVFAPRLLAELATAGLFTRTRVASNEPLDALARKHGCLSVVRAVPSGKGIELWFDETANGRPMVRNLVVDEQPLGPDVALVVLQTTELLRAGLQNLAAPAPTVKGTQRVRDEPTLPRRHTFVLGAGAGMQKQRGGFPSLPVFRVEAAWQFSLGVGPEVLLQGPWQASNLRTLEGSTKATPWSAAFGARLDHATSRWFGEVGVGLLWQIWHVEGVATSALNTRDQTFSQLGVYSRARAGANIASWLRCGLDVLGGANFSETRIIHAQRDVGGVGHLGAAALVILEALAL